MKIAVTTGVLRVPPTYFVVNHAQRLRAHHDFAVFALAAQVRDRGVDVPIHDFIGFGTLPFSRRAALGPLATPLMTAGIRRFQPDIIHQHFATWSRSAIAAAGSSVPLITTLHGYDVFLALQPASSPFDRLRIGQVNASRSRSRLVLAVSEYLASRAIDAGFAPERLRVHYQGVDTDYFVPESGIGADTRPVITFVGALAKRKGIRDLIEASVRLTPSVDHRLEIIGDGPLADEVRRATSRYSHIELRGVLDRASVRTALQRSTVMVLPAQEDAGRREAAGLVLVEAQACGTPVIAYDSGGTSEMLHPDVTGLLVPERDRIALEAALRDVLTLDSVGYANMRKAARDFAVKERSLERSCTELLEHYASVAN